jgi:hypothetical protein
MKPTHRTAWIVTMLVVAPALGVQAQWLGHPTVGIPRLPNGQANLSAPAPRSADGKPDLSGVWVANREAGTGLSLSGNQLPAFFVDIGARLKGGLPYRPWARDLVSARMADDMKDSPDANCLPIGNLWLHSHLFPSKIVQVPGLLVILYEKGVDYRQIFVDGRSLPTDPNPSFFGYSTAAWEGDTLVVQTNGLRDDSWADLNGNPLTDAARITERFRRPNFGALEIEVTVDDPKAYTASWTVTITQRLLADTDLLEFVCLENQKFKPLPSGK